jgi:hypothetical protein
MSVLRADTLPAPPEALFPDGSPATFARSVPDWYNFAAGGGDLVTSSQRSPIFRPPGRNARKTERSFD